MTLESALKTSTNVLHLHATWASTATIQLGRSTVVPVHLVTKAMDCFART